MILLLPTGPRSHKLGLEKHLDTPSSPRLPYDTAGASLRNVKAILEVFDSPSPLRRAQNFPWVISLSIGLSRDSSATSFFRRTFSFSSSLSRFA